MRKKAIIFGVLYCAFLVVGIWVRSSSPSPVYKISTPTPTSVPEVRPVRVSAPTLNTESAPASISAQSYVVYDVASNQVIYGKDQDVRLMPASTTKMMTALVAIETYSPDEIVTLTRATQAIGHTIDFAYGEQISVINMIKAMMINSGNDAAMSLADHHPEGYQAFVGLMNKKAKELKLTNTHFSNVSGVEAGDHYSSASDLAVIGSVLMQNETLRQIVDTKYAKIPTTDGDKTHTLENLNRLLWDTPGVIGIKTGWTEIAGDCLVAYTHREHDLITVVLKSKDRFGDSRNLIKWAYHNLTY